EVLVELHELVALAGEDPRRGRLAGVEWPRLDAGKMPAQVRKVPHLPEFAIPDAVDAAIELLAHHLVDTGVDHLRIDRLAAENPHRQRFTAGRDRQPSGMRGSDSVRASLHVIAPS